MDKPVYDLGAIEFQLQTSWSASFPYFEYWNTADTTASNPAVITYFIGNDTPVTGGQNDEGDGFVDMSADQYAAAQEAFQIWGRGYRLPAVEAGRHARPPRTSPSPIRPKRRWRHL